MKCLQLLYITIIGMCLGEKEDIENEIQEYFKSGIVLFNAYSLIHILIYFIGSNRDIFVAKNNRQFAVVVATLPATTNYVTRPKRREKDIVQEMRKQWEPHRKAYEDSIKQALAEQAGRKSMNIYMKGLSTYDIIAKGFLLSDNVVDLLLSNMTLRDIPELILPEVQLRLSDNVLLIDTTLRKIFIDGKYASFRNKSTVSFNEGAQTLLNNSPFSFDQVPTSGDITIIAENCVLEGSAIVTLLGYSVNLGYPTFQINECKFSVEIFNRNAGSPPVIVPYFSSLQRSQLQRVMRKPIVRSVTTLLQGVFISHINTTSIFGKNLMKYRHHQDQIFKRTSAYMVKTIQGLNKGIIIKNQGKLVFPDYHLFWDDKTEMPIGGSSISLTNLKLYGLDTAYCTNRGGAYKTMHWKLSEMIVFNDLHVQGVMSFNELNNPNITLSFAADLNTVGVSVTIGIDEIEDQDSSKKQATKSINTFNILNWKPMEFFVLNLDTDYKHRDFAHSFVHGYLMNKLPEWLIAFLSELFPKAINGDFDDSDLPVPTTDKNDDIVTESDECVKKGYVKPDPNDKHDDKNSGTAEDDDSSKKSPTNSGAESENDDPGNDDKASVTAEDESSKKTGPTQSVTDNDDKASVTAEDESSEKTGPTQSGTDNDDKASATGDEANEIQNNEIEKLSD